MLGNGGSAITYLGQDMILQKPIAIKEYYPDCFAGRESPQNINVVCGKQFSQSFYDIKRRFLEEAQMLAKFSRDPNIVPVHEIFEENNTIYIIMDYIEGQSLSKYLRTLGENSKIQPTALVTWFVPLLNTLMKIHNEGLIHRDIKPDNIMIEDNKLILIDFGSAHIINSDRTINPAYSPGYAPLEQYSKASTNSLAKFDNEQGTWTDIYAICATLYRCITGKQPPDATIREYDDTLHKPSELGIQIPAYIEHAIMQGLQVNYKERTQNVRTLLAELSGEVPEEDDDPVTVFMDDPDTALMDNPATASAGTMGTTGTEQKPTAPQRGQSGKKRRLYPVISALIAVCAAGVVGLGIWHFARQAKDAEHADILNSMIQEKSADTESYVILTDVSGMEESAGITEESELTQDYGKIPDESTKSDVDSSSSETNNTGKDKSDSSSSVKEQSIHPDNAPTQQQGQSGRERPSAQPAVKDTIKSDPLQHEDSKPVEVQSDYYYADYGIGCMITGMKTSMNRLDIPERIGEKQVLAIGDNAFVGKDGIETVSMPDSIESIGASAFEDCTSLSEVRFSQNLRTIGNYAFCNTGLYEIDLPGSLRELCEGAFYSNSGFEQIKIPNGVETIGDYAFGQCDMLEQVYIPVTVNHIGINGFKCDPPTPHHVEFGGSSAEWGMKDYSHSAFELDWNDPDIYYNIAPEWAFT